MCSQFWTYLYMEEDNFPNRATHLNTLQLWSIGNNIDWHKTVSINTQTVFVEMWIEHNIFPMDQWQVHWLENPAKSANVIAMRLTIL